MPNIESHILLLPILCAVQTSKTQFLNSLLAPSFWRKQFENGKMVKMTIGYRLLSAKHQKKRRTTMKRNFMIQIEH